MDLNQRPTDSGYPRLSSWPGLYHHPRIYGGVSDANSVLHSGNALNHLVSEPSPYAYGAWLLIGMLIKRSFPAIHPIFPHTITDMGHNTL